jgi:capsular polysaccharide biosynthesis protein
MNKDQLEFQPQQYDPYEDEIELMDYLKVLWKWKYLILLGTLACAVIAAVVSFNMTKIYSVKTILAPGVAKVEANGKITYIGSPQEIKTLIETGALEATVLKQVKVPSGENLPRSLSFKTTVPKGSNALEVTYETPRTDLGLQILNHLNQALLKKFDGIEKYFEEEYTIQMRSKSSESSRVTEKVENAKNAILTLQAENQSAVSEIKAKISSKESDIATNQAEKDRLISETANKISTKQSEIATNGTEKEGILSEIANKISSKKSKIEKIKAETLSQIDQKKNGISSLKARINGKKKQITNLEKRIVDINEEIIRISNNTDLLIEERNKFLASTKNENNILASVMYTTTIQQNIGYLNTLRSTVNNVNHRIFEEKVGIEKLENDVKDVNTQILDLQKQSEIQREQILSDIEEFQAQKTNLQKQTEIDNKKIKADIADLQAQKTNLQKQTTYKNQTLKSDIEDLVAQTESLTAQVNSKSQSLNAQVTALESEKNYILEEIKNLEFKKNYVQNIQILQPPKSSLGPVKPKKKLNILLAGVVGLFLTVFLAFFIEYISRHNDNENNR